MIATRKLIGWLALFGCLTTPLRSEAQFFKEPATSLTRNNPAFLKAFREATVKTSESTVRVQCNGKDTALGMIVGPDGWILTKACDLTGEITVTLKDGKAFDARWVGKHEQHDVALLKIDASGLMPVSFTESKDVGVGNWVACVGTGEDPVAIGVVSVATRTIPKENLRFQKIDFSKRGFLGIELEPGEGHPRIKTVREATPAAKIGLKDKDLVLALNGVKMTEVEQLIDAIGNHKPGDTVVIKVRRGDVELDLKPTLDRQPFGANRNQMQNSMGSQLSSRTTGYPTILQHDSVVKPADCGGPIVDLQGRVIGINITRAGRVESWAVPSEALQPIMFDLMAGKMPPKIDAAKLTLEQQLVAARKALKRAEDDTLSAAKKLADLKTTVAKLETQSKALAIRPPDAPTPGSTATTETIAPPKTVKNEDVVGRADKVVELMQKRLQLMKDVASAKWQAKQTGADAMREQELLDQLVAQGLKLGLSAEIVRTFFAAQLDAAKQVQQTFFDRFQKDKIEVKDAPDLQKDLRPKLDQVSQDLLAAFAQVQPHLSNPAVQERLRERAAKLLNGDGVSDAIRNRALEPLMKR